MEPTTNRNLTRQLILTLALIGSFLTGPLSAGEVWTVDNSHSKVGFAVNHFFTPVPGSFDDFEIELNFVPDQPEKSSVQAKIPVASINTGNEQRDGHLKSADWFEAEQFPYITFKSTSVKKMGKNQFIATGMLEIKGQRMEVNLPITHLGTQAVPENMQAIFGGSQEVASFKAALQVDRGEFEVGTGSWAGTLVVGGEVDIEILIEAHRK